MKTQFRDVNVGMGMALGRLTMLKQNQNDPKMDPKRLQNDPKTIKTASQDVDFGMGLGWGEWGGNGARRFSDFTNFSKAIGRGRLSSSERGPRFWDPQVQYITKG